MTPISALPRAMRRVISCREGSTAVEFAALGPIFVLLMLFVFQFATALQAAARGDVGTGTKTEKGARYRP